MHTLQLSGTVLIHGLAPGHYVCLLSLSKIASSQSNSSSNQRHVGGGYTIDIIHRYYQ